MAMHHSSIGGPRTRVQRTHHHRAACTAANPVRESSDSRFHSRVTTDAFRGSGSDPTTCTRRTRRVRQHCTRTIAGAALASTAIAATLCGGTASAAAIATAPCSDAVVAPPSAMTEGRSVSQTVVVPEGITRDGSVNVAPELQKFLQTVPPGPDADHVTVVEFQPGGCYRVDDTLTLGKRGASGPAGLHWPDLNDFKLDNVVLDLRGSVLVQGDSTPWTARTTTAPAQQPQRKYGNPLLFLPGVSGVSIRNGTLRGMNTAGAYIRKLRENWACVWVAGALPGEPAPSRVEISGMNLTGCWGDAVYVTGLTTLGLQVSGLDITDNRINGTGRDGVTVQGASDVRVERNQFRRIPRFVFDGEPSASMGLRGLTWSNNTGASGHLGYAQWQGPARAIGERLVFEGNTIDEGTLKMVIGGSSAARQGLTIRNNRNIGSDVFTPKTALLMRHLFMLRGNWNDLQVTGNQQAIATVSQATCAVNTGTNLQANVAGNDFMGSTYEVCGS